MTEKTLAANRIGGEGKTTTTTKIRKIQLGRYCVRIRQFLYGFAAGIILFSAQTANAFCYEEAGAMYNVSPQLLMAISKAESNFNPQAINFNKNGTYDYGLMQINSFWHDVIGDRAWGALSDPCYNTKIGAWILSDCINRNGYTWEAVGCYNARSPEKRKKYSARIYRIMREIYLNQVGGNIRKDGADNKQTADQNEYCTGHGQG